MTSKLSPQYDSPYVAYTMRILAWQTYIAKEPNKITDNDIEKALIRALKELGDIDISAPTISSYVDEIRGLLDKTWSKPKGWTGKEWYLLHAPFHQFVRSLSANPVVQGPNNYTFDITLRDPAVAGLKVMVGTGQPDSSVFAENRRIIYILRHGDQELGEAMYIGITDNDERRMREHFEKKNPYWWFITQPLEGGDLDTDVQNSTETMLIAFWNEIADLSNDKWGSTTTPVNFPDRQQTTLLTTAISAAYIWLIRDQENLMERLQLKKKSQWQLPLKTWKRTGFAERYPNVDSLG